MKFLIFLLSSMTTFGSAWAAPLRVVVTLSDFVEMVKTVGGNDVQVESLLVGVEDPHFLEGKPNFVSRVADADLLVSNGLELESGWLTKVVARSGNAVVQPGSPGFCELGTGVQVLEKPEGPIDRSMGHVHAAGNPHFNLSPEKMREAAKVLVQCLTSLRPASQTKFENGLSAYDEKMKKLSATIRELLEPIRSKLSGHLMEYHQNFVYFLDEFKIRSAGSVEEKPGVAPSAGRLAKISDLIKTQGIREILVPTTLSHRGAEKLQELAGVSLITQPTLVQLKGDQDQDSEALLLGLARKMAQGAERRP